MEPKTLFGQRLKQLREEAKLTQEELAIKLDTKKQYISRYELDQFEPSFYFLVKAADLFRVTTDYLLGRSEMR